MSPLSVQEIEGLRNDFAQLDINAGMKPHYLEREEATRETIRRAKAMDFTDTKMSETMAGAYLAPEKASRLLEYRPYMGNVPDSMENEVNLRLRANEVAWQIHLLDDPKVVPALFDFVREIDIDNLDRQDTVSGAIVEKVAIVGLHKIIELMGKDGAQIEMELPKSVSRYIDTITRIKSTLASLEELAAVCPVLEASLQEAARPDEKWQGQNQMEKVLKDKKYLELGYQVFNVIVGSESVLKGAIKYSRRWEKEGLSTDGIYHLREEEVIRLVQLGVRYFSWYTLLDEQWTGEFEENYVEDFESFAKVFTDKNDPNYLGNLISEELHKSICGELERADQAIFES